MLGARRQCSLADRRQLDQRDLPGAVLLHPSDRGAIVAVRILAVVFALDRTAAELDGDVAVGAAADGFIAKVQRLDGRRARANIRQPLRLVLHHSRPLMNVRLSAQMRSSAAVSLLVSALVYS